MFALLISNLKREREIDTPVKQPVKRAPVLIVSHVKPLRSIDNES